MRRLLSIPLAAAAVFALIAPTASAEELDAQRAVSAPPWASRSADSLIAPLAACPGQDRLDTSAPAQREAMHCMTEYARAHAGLPPLAPEAELDASAAAKSDDVLRCDDFSHAACGRDFTYWMRETGYLSTQCWRAGENLAWGADEEGTVRAIFRAWMRSPGHRENILGEFGSLGVGLRTGDLAGLGRVQVWTQHFGSHCE
ncbi:MAG TPA: CAP domain-containing protein [Solirubrobacterales bacterium]